MSTKIYDAYVWHGQGGIGGLLKKMAALRQRLFKIAVTEAAKRTTAESFNVVEYTDDLRAGMKSGMHFTDKGNINPSSSATIHLYRDQIYVLFFGLTRSTPTPPFSGLYDFHYQNQTDREDGITDKQWEYRRRTWDGIFKKDLRPSHVGLVFEIIDDSDALYLAYAIFKRLHGHSVGDDKGINKCYVCIAKRLKWQKSQEKKK